jgi:two-component system, cell cycle sensor histidine kinase and response regulator CckA
MRGTVMIVENETLILEAMQDILHSAGLSPICVRSGQDSLLVFQKRHDEIDLVILDLNLPGMEGADVLTALRKIKPQVPVIISSGYDEQDIWRRLGQQTAVSILRKPYNIQTLLQHVQQELIARHPPHSRPQG